MDTVPEKILKPYLDFLKIQIFETREIPHFLKWLRFYLNFCGKYSHKTSSPGSLPLFISKLEHKNQTVKQVEQARRAVTFLCADPITQKYAEKIRHT